MPHVSEAVRRGRWKMLPRDGVPVALYDMDADVGEQTNLLDGEAGVVTPLKGETLRFLAAPRDRTWQPGPEGARR